MANKAIVGVSGGPDSMCFLTKIAKNRLYSPVAVHINYNFRNESVKTPPNLLPGPRLYRAEVYRDG